MGVGAVVAEESKSTLSNCFASNGKKQIHMASHHCH